MKIKYWFKIDFSHNQSLYLDKVSHFYHFVYRYNNQLSVLRTDLRFCKRKSTDQTKQITELQNMLAEQQKQMLEYANRLDENDKKSEEMSRKISTLLQELNKCKIELHYYRSKSPATPICNNCQTTLAVPPADLITLLKQSINSRDGIINVTTTQMNDFESESEVQNQESNTVDLIIEPQLQATVTTTASITTPATIAIPINNNKNDNTANESKALNYVNSAASISSIENVAQTKSRTNHKNDQSVFAPINNILENNADRKRNLLPTVRPIASSIDGSIQTMLSPMVQPQIQQNYQNSKKLANISSASVILTVGTPRFYGKRKSDEYSTLPTTTATITEPLPSTNISATINNINSGTIKQNAAVTNNLANSNHSDSYSKKARRVQSKMKLQNSNMNIKTRNK